MHYVLKRKSDGRVMEARHGAPYKEVPEGWVALELDVAPGGTLDGSNAYTPREIDTAAEAVEAAIVNDLQALDPTAHGEPLNTIIKFLQR